VRQFAHEHRAEVVGIVLVEPANENGKLIYRGRFVLARTLATNRPIPPPRMLSEQPPVPLTRADCDSSRARAARTARIVRPYDQLDAQAQRYRIRALSNPACVVRQDDYFVEESASFFSRWSASPHPLGDLPLIVVNGGAPPRSPPPGLVTEEEWRSDSLRIDLSRLSSRGRLVTDSLSGHQLQLDNPRLVIRLILELIGDGREHR